MRQRHRTARACQSQSGAECGGGRPRDFVVAVSPRSWTAIAMAHGSTGASDFGMGATGSGAPGARPPTHRRRPAVPRRVNRRPMAAAASSARAAARPRAVRRGTAHSPIRCRAAGCRVQRMTRHADQQNEPTADRRAQPPARRAKKEFVHRETLRRSYRPVRCLRASAIKACIRSSSSGGIRSACNRLATSCDAAPSNTRSRNRAALWSRL